LSSTVWKITEVENAKEGSTLRKDGEGAFEDTSRSGINRGGPAKKGRFGKRRVEGERSKGDLRKKLGE